jgi:hypothetical protein
MRKSQPKHGVDVCPKCGTPQYPCPSKQDEKRKAKLRRRAYSLHRKDPKAKASDLPPLPLEH